MRYLALVGLAGLGCVDLPTITDSDTGFVNDVDRDGFSSSEGDCNDEDDTIFPGAWDIVADGIDRNCDGIPGIDDDGDERAWTGSGGVDCNDDDPTIFGADDRAPADEIGWDGIDQDCDLTDRHDFSQICAGDDHTCGIDTTGRIRCWGINDLQTQNTPPADGTVWVSLDCGIDSTCAVSEDGDLACWGQDDPDRGLIVSTQPTVGEFRSVFVGSYHGCALDAFGAATCWGWDDDGQVSGLPQGAFFESMGLGEDHSCGIRGQRRVMDCWGADGPGNLIQTTPDENYFEGWLTVTGGRSYACAVRNDLGRDCWGDDLNNQAPDNQAGPFGQQSAGSRFVCAIRELKPICQGEENPFQVINATPTDVDMRFIAGGEGHACGIRQANGEVICWGKNDNGQATVPDWPNIAF